MSEEVVVTRGSQITLTKGIRDKTHIKEGDVVVLNIIGDVVMVSKKNAKIFDEVEEFLPENFEKIMKRMRSDSKERFKKLGIVQ